VAWWPDQGNAVDVVNTNNGTLVGPVVFAAGEVGEAFSFDGTSSYVSVAASPGLNVGLSTNGFTIEAWISPGPTTMQYGAPIIEWDSGSTIGTHFWAFNYLYANLIDTAGNPHAMQSANNSIAQSVLQHVAFTYDPKSGNAILYCNGTNILTQNLGSFVPQTSYPLNIGRRIGGGEDFQGLIDEPSIYNRVLSANEIAAIYLAGANGKCMTPIPPTISMQPTNQLVPIGGAAVFTVEASGSAPLLYQWEFNGTNILNATNSVLTLLNVQTNQAGNYSVVVSNSFGVTNSIVVALSEYGVPPAITMQPTGQAVILGSSVMFSVTATGTPSLVYQWMFNGTNIVNATNAILTLTNVQTNQSGNYSVLVTNLYGSTNSAVAVLSVNLILPCDPLPTGIVAWWPGQSNAADIINGNNGTIVGNLAFTNGEVGLAFMEDGSSTYVTVPASSSLNVGSSSNGFTIETWISPGPITMQYGAPIIEYDSTSALGVQFWANGSGGLFANLIDTSGTAHAMTSVNGLTPQGVLSHVAFTYDRHSGNGIFYRNGTNVMVQNLGIFTPQTTYGLNIGRRTAGPGYNFQGVIDEPCIYNRVLSSNEISAIYLAGSNGKCFTPSAPFITSQPTNQAVLIGGTAIFAVTVTGSTPLAYQWGFNGTNILNATNAVLKINNAQFTNAGTYAVTVTNIAGLTVSSNAVLVVQSPPGITAHPTNQTTGVGGSASFTVVAGGSLPLNYQWYFNTNTAIAGATNAVLTLANLQFTNSGYYLVKVTNLFGAVVSSNASLTVQSPPIILVQPTNLIAYVGSTPVFTANVSGSLPLNYQWSFNGVSNAIAGATNAAFIIPNVQLANAGMYAMTVTNSFGAVVSINAFLTVIDTLDHFSWSQIPSPRFINVPFNVRIQARDSINQVFSNFTGSISLTTTNGILLAPSTSGNFSQGFWSGQVTIHQTVTNLVLQASDGLNHFGSANAIVVETEPMLQSVRDNNFLLVYWPADPAGFVLECSTNLSQPQWSQVPISPLQIGDQNLDLIQLTDTNEFYRLQFTLP
jgi:hypothetical protein